MTKKTQTPFAQRLKELRKEKGVTQKQLASETDISLPSIIDYENGRREPNAKAMAALEKYLHVSGAYLLGEVSMDTFLQDNDATQGCSYNLIVLMQSFKRAFDCNTPEQQTQALSILSGVLPIITKQLLQQDSPVNLNASDIIAVFQSAFNLNSHGRAELAKRAEELTQLFQYRA